MKFETKFIDGMLNNGYPLDFAQRLFEQIKGFGGYGFPESHSASFAILCYFSSWLKRHHPAAFYCALLNSQPMGFYSASQLMQDARRHQVQVLPVDINKSSYDNRLEPVDYKNDEHPWGIRLGFRRVRSLDNNKAEAIESYRQDKPFKHLDDLVQRTHFSSADLQCLAAADALRPITGNRHQAHWQSAGVQPYNAFLHQAEEPAKNETQDLFTLPPSTEKDIIDDYSSLGLSLRTHPMRILRNEYPFNRCKTYSDLFSMNHGRFVRVAGLVTGRQRPGTAKGTLFLTLEDETGNINVIVWKDTQSRYRQPLLTAKLLLVKGTLEINRNEKRTEASVIHVVAGQLIDYSERLTESFNLKSRDFH